MYIIISLIITQIFITDGCVITRTNKDNKNDISSENILKPIYSSIQNQGGLYLHIIIISFILGIKSILNYSTV